MDILKEYNHGANVSIMDTHYIYPKRQEGGKYDTGKLIILYKDNNTGEKKLEEIEDPLYTMYKLDDSIYIDHNLFFVEEEKVEPITVPYRNVLLTIAELVDKKTEYFDNIKCGNRRENDTLHAEPTIFNSDMNIEDAYRLYFDEEYKNEAIPVSKGYLDIELDTIGIEEDFPTGGKYPINAVSYVNTRDNKVSVFLLRDPENPQISEFEAGLKDGEIFKELKEFVINHVGGPLYAQKHKIIDFDYNFYFFDEEIDLIYSLFKLINFDELDFLLVWNMAFDIPYIVDRIRVLGYNPEDVMCHKDCKTKYVKYYIDERNKQKPAERSDYYKVAGKTVYLDQMVNFASRRKGRSAFSSLKLDYIGSKVAKVGKLDWSNIAKTFADFIRKDYKTFIFYNIMDTIVQHCVENKTGDVDYVYNKCHINNTRYSKCHRQSIYLTNRATKEFKKNHYIIGNNVNKFNEKPKIKFPGAMVGDPTHNNTFAKLCIAGEYINVCDNCDDYDYKSLYPSITRENGIAPNTQIGMVVIDNVVYKNENPFKNAKYSRGGSFLEDFRTDNILIFCNRWLHLGGYKDLINDMEEFFVNNPPKGRMHITDKINILYHREDKRQDLMVPRSSKRRNLMIYYPEKRDYTNEIAYLKEHAQMDLNNEEKLLARRQREMEEEQELAKRFGYEEEQTITVGGDNNE